MATTCTVKHLRCAGESSRDIISPIFFILALEQLFRLHDKNPAGAKIDNYLEIDILGYADDAALVSRATALMTTRLTSISQGSRTDADMHLHKGKMQTMHVREQEKLALPTFAEIKKTENTYKHQCMFCDRKFKTSRGLHIHMASCNNQHGLTSESFEIDSINATFGTPKNRWFRVSWTGYAASADSWDPDHSLVRQGCQQTTSRNSGSTATSTPPLTSFLTQTT